MIYGREQMSDVLAEIKPLLEKHWQEIAHYQDIPLDPYWQGYKDAETAGKLRIFTVREDSALVGYAVFFIGNLHYKSTPMATQDILFLLPEHRNRKVGAGLIQYCDDQLRAEGCKVTYHHVKRAHDFSPLLEALGYEAVDTVYGRRL
jgi:GNAT superfamily N-acetyltransferase